MPSDPRREEELKKWNRPYEYHEFPKMLYRRTMTPTGKVEPEERIVNTAAEEDLAKAEGWFDHPQTATDAANRAHRERQDQERQAENRHQAELIEQAISKVLGRRKEARRTPDPGREARAARRQAFYKPRLLQKGWKINAWAEAGQFDPNTGYRYRDGFRISPDSRVKLAKGLGVEPEELPE